jgi:hypothetical protein
MHQEPLVTFGSCVLETSKPKVASDCCKLFGEGDYLQVSHKTVCQVCIRLSVIGKLFEVVVVLVKLWQHIIIEIFPLNFELCMGEVSQIIIRLSDELFRIQKSINQKSSTTNHPRNPAVT